MKIFKIMFKLCVFIFSLIFIFLLFDYFIINVLYYVNRNMYVESFDVRGNTNKYTPQALAYSNKYDVILQTSYSSKHDISMLYVTDFKTGKLLKALKLKDDNKDLLNLFNAIQSDDLYIEAQKYRTAAAHGTSAGDISNTVTTQRDVITEIPELVDGKLTKKMIKAKMVVAVGVGDYTKTETIMTNIEQYSKFTGLIIQEAINLME